MCDGNGCSCVGDRVAIAFKNWALAVHSNPSSSGHINISYSRSAAEIGFLARRPSCIWRTKCLADHWFLQKKNINYIVSDF